MVRLVIGCSTCPLLDAGVEDGTQCQHPEGHGSICDAHGGKSGIGQGLDGDGGRPAWCPLETAALVLALPFVPAEHPHDCQQRAQWKCVGCGSCCCQRRSMLDVPLDGPVEVRR